MAWAEAVDPEGRSEHWWINVCVGRTAMPTPGTPHPRDKTSQTKVQDGGRVDTRSRTTTFRKEIAHRYE